MTSFMTVLLIGLFSGLGATARYFGGRLMSKHTSWQLPWPTFAVNMIAVFMIGFFFGEPMTSSLYKIVTVGFCGGLSTQSTFNFELYAQLETHSFKQFVTYFFMTYAGGILICLLGVIVGKSLRF